VVPSTEPPNEMNSWKMFSGPEFRGGEAAAIKDNGVWYTFECRRISSGDCSVLFKRRVRGSRPETDCREMTSTEWSNFMARVRSNPVSELMQWVL
jgi:hypothetical protein